MTISATMVKELREKSGAGMMDCKKALSETNGDFEEAIDWLRKKGLSAATKKSGRIAAEGLVAIHLSNQANKGKGTVIEVNAETDFVARNEVFQGFVGTLSEMANQADNQMDKLLGMPYPASERNVGEELTHNIATIGENMSIRRFVTLAVEPGVVNGYIHSAVVGGKGVMGRIGVLVALKSSAKESDLMALSKQIAMHIAAARPQFLDVASIREEDRNREKQILTEQARAEGRPENIIEKMVEGRMRKYHEEVALLEQPFVMDPEVKIAKLLENKSKEFGSAIELTAFVRYELGEGIERKVEDFAAEVAATLKG